MHGPSTSDLETASPRLTWSEYNERGLASAADGAWDEATSAFRSAADALATENDVASHEALALVLNNLAHGCYRVGQIEDAIRHAQRVCALRVALVGEDAIAVARAWSDLAVLLSSSGRADEALALVTRAIAGIERSAGDEAVQLLHVLENAARVAMSAGQPSTAEPYLLRLHALLAAHDMPTDRADVLLAGVAHHRTHARQAFGLSTPARVHAAIVDVAAETSIPADDTVVVDSLDELTPADFAFEEGPPSNGIDGLEIELVELEPVAGKAVAPPAPPVSTASQAVDVLGFEVRYGTQTDEEVVLSPSRAGLRD